MKDRLEKIKMLNRVFNDGNKDSLRSLSRQMYPSILIFRTNGDVMNLSPRLNPTLPEKYTNRNLDEAELDAMLSTGGNRTTFFLPENGRD